MSSSESHGQSPTQFRSRRAHRKSRNGCLECKRRKVKCDETKPSCGRCVAGLQKCFYALAPLSPKDHRDKPVQPAPPSRMLSQSPEVSSCMETFLSSKAPTQIATSIGIPPRALRHKTVFYSLLALCEMFVGCSMISKHPPADPGTVIQILMGGYHHYNLASEQMREMISDLDATKVEPLLASNTLLVPFSAASQQIHHWFSSRNDTRESQNLLCSTPREIIITMRGIRTTLQALHYQGLGPGPFEDTKLLMNKASTLDSDVLFTASCAGRGHVMFPILAQTSSKAFDQLQQRLVAAGKATPCPRHPDNPLSACVSAFEVLDDIRMRAFGPLKQLNLVLPTSKIRMPSRPEQAWLPRVVPWLVKYTCGPTPKEPLTRMFLRFLVQVPQSYIDLIMPLLEQRLKTPNATPSDNAVKLTTEQAIALDIYAHWSVLMFLVEKESWWIGSLPLVTLVGMINRYGDNFIVDLQPEQRHRHEWWPGVMLNVLQEIEREQSSGRIEG